VLPFSLGLSASLCWGLADFLGGVETRRLPAPLVVLVSQAVGLAAIAVIVVVGASQVPSGGGMMAAVLAGVVGVIGITSFYRALAIGKMSIVAPITATGAIVPVIVGLANGERPGMVQVVGMLAAGVGVVLAAQDGEKDGEARRISRQSIVLALVAAVSIGTALAAIDRAADSGVFVAVFWSRLVSVALLLLVVILIRPQVAGLGSSLRGVALIGVLDTSATALYALATTHGLLSVVAVTSSLYPVTTVVMARLVLAERVRRIQAVGVTAALGGVALLATG
jgi:drug/metabolite transporter (DMT)-like permease